MTIHPLTEKLSKIICCGQKGCGANPDQSCFAEDFHDEANVAIRAVLTFEPTENAICQGDDEIVSALNEIPPDPKFTKGMPAERCYRAMTAALLKEVENG